MKQTIPLREALANPELLGHLLSGPTWRDGKVQVTWPDQPMFADAGTVMSAPAGSASKLLACLFPDQVYDLLIAGVDRIKGGITAADRARKINELETQLLELGSVPN